MEGGVNKVDDLSAAVQVIESIGDLIEASKDEAEKLIEAEFAGIFAQLESRETALIKRAKAISASKTSALRTHSAKLEAALAALADPGAATAGLARLEDGSIDPREAISIAIADDPIFQAEAEAEIRELVESFGVRTAARLY